MTLCELVRLYQTDLLTFLSLLREIDTYIHLMMGSHVTPLNDHLDFRNAMLPLKVSLVSCLSHASGTINITTVFLRSQKKKFISVTRLFSAGAGIIET